MKRVLTACLILSMLVAGCSSSNTNSSPTPTLDPAGWNPSTHQALVDLVQANRNSGKIATFDWDNTSQARDVGEATVGRADADKLIDPKQIPAAVVPPFTLNGKKIDISAGISDYYNNLASIDPKDPFASYPSDNIIGQYWTGRPLSQFADAVKAAYDNGGGQQEIESGTEELVGGFGRQFVYPQMADLYGYLIANGIDVWTVSAGIVWAVRWMIANQMNPLIAAKYGPTVQMNPSHVTGIAMLLKDTRTGALMTDNQLARTKPNQAFLDMNPEEISHYQITGLPDAVNSWRGGKVAAIQDLITRERVLLAGGDSQGDFEMLNMAENRLWITRLENPSIQQQVAQQFEIDQPGNWLLQPTISTAPVGFKSSECELNQDLAEHPNPTTSAAVQQSLQALDPSGFLSSWRNCDSN